MKKADFQKIPIGELNPAVYNPRKDLKPGDAEYEKLKRSIETFGYVEPVIWNKATGNVVGGHQRLKVLRDLGHTEIDCMVVEMGDLDEKALNVALNKIDGEWDDEKLTELLAELEATELDITLTGFDAADVSELLTESDGEKNKSGESHQDEGLFIQIGTFQIPLDDDENEELKELATKYITEHGVAHGFIRVLLGL